MADKDLTIGIKVTADTKGAADAAKAISDAMEAANKKPFQMPIDEAGMKAREEAMRLQQQQTAEDAKSIPVAEAVAKARRQIGETNKEAIRQNVSLIASQRQEIGVIQSATVTANGAKKAKEELGKSSGNAGMGVLALSNAFQDAQYGMAGIVNNIPMMVSGLGLGMGVAGVAQAAAVGVQILTKNFDLFGTEAAKAAEEAEKNQQELNKLANESRIAAEKAEALAKSQRELANELRNTTTAYDEATSAADRAFRKQEEAADAEMKRTDAAFEKTIAMIDLQEAAGEITAGEATQKRAGARAQATARREQIEIDRLKAAEEQAKKEMEAAAEGDRRTQEVLAGKMNQANGEKILTEAQRKYQEQLLDANQQYLETAKEEYLAKKKAFDEFNGAGIMDPSMRAAAQNDLQKQMTDADRKVASAKKVLAETQGKLVEDEKARTATGTKSQEDFQQQREQIEGQALEFRKRQEDAAASGASAAGRRGTLEELIPMRAETEAMRTSAAERTRQAEEQRKAEEAAARRQKDVDEAASAGSSLASALAGSGASSQFMAQLNAASSGKDVEALMKLVEQLLPSVRNLDDKTRARLEKLQAELDDLRSAK
jgi:hypothetical protein